MTYTRKSLFGFALRDSICIVPRMPGRGYRTPAAGIIAAVGLIALLVTGCDSHSKPTALPSSSGSASNGTGKSDESLKPNARPSSGVTSSGITGESALASAFPSAAIKVPAAIQTVREFFTQMNHEIDTGDEGPVSALFTSRCTRCAQGVIDFKNMLKDGHTIRGAHLHLVSIDSAAPTYSEVVTVTATESEDAGAELDAKGNVVRTFTAVAPTKLVFNLAVDRTPPVIWQLDLVTK